jgi:hypothetical protein
MGVRGLLRVMIKIEVVLDNMDNGKCQDFRNCKDLFNTKQHKVCLPINPFGIENLRGGFIRSNLFHFNLLY